jgi:uncharacterized protein (DUF2249 family)
MFECFENDFMRWGAFGWGRIERGMEVWRLNDDELVGEEPEGVVNGLKHLFP